MEGFKGERVGLKVAWRGSDADILAWVEIANSGFSACDDHESQGSGLRFRARVSGFGLEAEDFGFLGFRGSYLGQAFGFGMGC